jgi:hypothetical protein
MNIPTPNSGFVSAVCSGSADQQPRLNVWLSRAPVRIIGSWIGIFYLQNLRLYLHTGHTAYSPTVLAERNRYSPAWLIDHGWSVAWSARNQRLWRASEASESQPGSFTTEFNKMQGRHTPRAVAGRWGLPLKHAAIETCCHKT